MFLHQMDCVKRIWYLLPMRAAKVQASLHIHAVSPEPLLLVHTSSESRRILRQKARSLAPLNGWACAVKICHDRMPEDTNSLDGAQIEACHESCRSTCWQDGPKGCGERKSGWTASEEVSSFITFSLQDKGKNHWNVNYRSHLVWGKKSCHTDSQS